MEFEIPDSPDDDVDQFIMGETRKYNAQFVPDDHKALSVYCRDKEGKVVGGLTGKTYWNYLDIGFLWVDEQSRNNSLAAEIIKLAEDEAKRRGCTYSMLDTFEFQALGFYLKQGYEQFGKLEGYCERFERYYLRKKIS